MKNFTFEEALAAGYRISKAKRPGKKLQDLCERLGDEYHLATIDYGNVVHRVVGDGWDVEIYPSSRNRYGVTLWKDYGRQSVVTETDVKDVDDAVACTVEMLLHLYVPEEIYPTRYNIGPRVAVE